MPTDVTELAFPAVQTYSSGEEVAWIDTAADGAEPEHPAPTVQLVAADRGRDDRRSRHALDRRPRGRRARPDRGRQRPRPVEASPAGGLTHRRVLPVRAHGSRTSVGVGPPADVEVRPSDLPRRVPRPVASLAGGQPRHGARVWLCSWRPGRGRSVCPYPDAVEEAFCFGWIGSSVNVLDDDRALQLMTPWKAKSTWTRLRRQPVATMEAAGLMTDAGRRAVEVAQAERLVDDLRARRGPRGTARAGRGLGRRPPGARGTGWFLRAPSGDAVVGHHRGRSRRRATSGSPRSSSEAGAPASGPGLKGQPWRTARGGRGSSGRRARRPPSARMRHAGQHLEAPSPSASATSGASIGAARCPSPPPRRRRRRPGGRSLEVSEVEPLVRL